MRLGQSAILIGLLILAECGRATEPRIGAGTHLTSKADDSTSLAPKSQSPFAKKKKVKLPGEALWDLQVLQGSFTIISTQYDAAKRQITWVLEAKKQVKCLGYHALFRDADKVRAADISITLVPCKKEYAKGSRITATLQLPGQEEFEQSNTVAIKAFTFEF
jgi:hypothetical protein